MMIFRMVILAAVIGHRSGLLLGAIQHWRLGDWLIGESFNYAAEAATLSRTPQLVSILAKHMKDTTSGQAMEFEMKRYPEWNEYLKIIRGKTAPLFIAPVEGMAIVAGVMIWLNLFLIILMLLVQPIRWPMIF